MQLLADRLSGFAAALLDPLRTIPPGLVGPDGKPSAKRFAVYQNNVVVGLTEALQANFPSVCRIVGEEFFRAMAQTYVSLEPPATPILLDYGAGFANFVAEFEPAASLPYLPDVARIERAWMEVYHSAEAEPLSTEILAGIPNNKIAEVRFTLHPALRIVRSPFPALTIWRTNVADGEPGPVDLDAGGEDALIMRPAAEMEVRVLPPGTAEFLTKLSGGEKLPEATKSALCEAPRFDLSATLAMLIEAGAFVDYALAEAVCKADLRNIKAPSA